MDISIVEIPTQNGNKGKYRPIVDALLALAPGQAVKVECPDALEMNRLYASVNAYFRRDRTTSTRRLRSKRKGTEAFFWTEALTPVVAATDSRVGTLT